MKKPLALLSLMAGFLYAAVVLAAVVPVGTARRLYTSTTVSTASYYAMATVSATVNEVEIFDSSGQTLYLATGTASAESNRLVITPGGNGRVPLSVPAGTRFSITAAPGNTATAGEIDINFYK